MPATTDFADLVKDELAKARNNHPPLNSAHEALAVIWEEFEEFKEEVFRRETARIPEAMLLELVQTAAMCQRAAEDLALSGRLSDAVFGRSHG